MSNEQVPSWAVTGEQLASWGFPVERRDHCVGMGFVAEAGMPFHKARHAAWAAGHLRIASMPEEVRDAQLAAFHEGIAEMRRQAQENLAFLLAHDMIKGPRAARVQDVEMEVEA